MISLFRTNRPTVFISLLLFTVLLRGAFFLFPALNPPQPDAYMGPGFMSWVENAHIPVLYLQIADTALIYIEAVLFNLILTSTGLFDRNTFVPAMVFILLNSLFGPWITAGLHTIGQLFLLISLYNLFSLTGKELSRETIFYTSFFLSLGSLFYFPISIFLIIIIIGLVMRSYSMLDFLLLISGFVLPFYFIGIGEYYYGDLNRYFSFLQHLVLLRPNLSLDVDILQVTMLVYVLLLAVLGYFSLWPTEEFKIIRQRRLLMMLLIYLGLSVAAVAFVPGSKLIYLQMLIVPASVFVAKLFDRRRLHIIYQALFALLMAGIAFFELYYFKIL